MVRGHGCSWLVLPIDAISGRRTITFHHHIIENAKTNIVINMTPGLRKVLLLTHIASSVGWFGAVVPYLALTIAGLTSHDIQVVRAAYISMDLIGWFVIVPFSLAALLTGLVQSLFTQWGLFRYWWIVAKLVLTIVSVVILLRHMQGASHMAHMAAATSLPADFRSQQIEHLIHPAGGLLVLLATMALSVLKPGGMTPYGRRKASVVRPPAQVSENKPSAYEPMIVTKSNWQRIIGIHAAHALAIALILAVVLHLSSRGMHHH